MNNHVPGPRMDLPGQEELPLKVTEVVTPVAKSPAELVGEYIELRDKKAEAKAAYEAFVKEHITDRMEEIEGALLAAMKLAGVTSMVSPHGTVYKNNRASATVADQATFRGFVVGRMLWDLVDWRANKTQVKTFLEKHKELPPGINYNVHVTVGIRRPGSKNGENDE